MPPIAEMKASVEALAKGLAARIGARRAEEYIGPVLFEGEAAGEFLLQLLVDRLANPREPLGARGGGGTPFKNRLRKRVLPSFLSVVDDPSVTSFGGKQLLGAYTIDDDGFPAQKVSLVEEGRLLSWYMSRVPTREIPKTNGHSRNGVGDAGCVIVTSKQSVPEKKLREELLRNAREQELPFAVRVETISRPDLRVRGARGPGGRGGTSEASLSSPIRAYWVSVEDESEEPMRGAEFQAVTLRTLRDVMMTSVERHVLNTTRRGHPISIVSPSLLVEEMEMRKPTDEQVKAPQLKHPFFDKP
jgi:predicted Zn-dependent protease